MHLPRVTPDCIPMSIDGAPVVAEGIRFRTFMSCSLTLRRVLSLRFSIPDCANPVTHYTACNEARLALCGLSRRSAMIDLSAIAYIPHSR